MPKEVSGVNSQQQPNYTKVRVRDINTGKIEVFKMQNAKITGNKTEYTIKDGKVYDKDGNWLDGNAINLLKYQAAAIRAAAAGGDDPHVLNTKDLTGSKYAEDLEAELQKNKSEFHVANNTSMAPELGVKDADALEYGLIYANLVNAKGESGKITIDFNVDKK